MSQIRLLGLGLIVLTIVLAFAYGPAKTDDTPMRFKGLPMIFDKASYPELFEARARTFKWAALLLFAFGLILLVFSP